MAWGGAPPIPHPLGWLPWELGSAPGTPEPVGTGCERGSVKQAASTEHTSEYFLWSSVGERSVTGRGRGKGGGGEGRGRGQGRKRGNS